MKIVNQDQGKRRSPASAFVGYISCFILGGFFTQQLLLLQSVSVNFFIKTSSADADGDAPSSQQSATYGLANTESLGFFDDVPDHEWKQIQKRVTDIHPNTNGDPYKGRTLSKAFYQNHYEPNFACRHENRIGRLGDGGKWVCDPHRLKAKTNSFGSNNNISTTVMEPPPPCLVYSIGSNGDPSFERSVRHELGPHCEIHVFDMDNYTDKVEGAVPENCYFHQWGIGKENNLVPNRRGRIYKTLKQTMFELGHLDRPVDIFKIDCEGCEWQIFPDFFLPGIDLRQILIELHANRDRRVHMPQTVDFFKAMEKHYVIFHKEPNIQYSEGAAAIEYAFLKLNTSFFMGIVDE